MTRPKGSIRNDLLICSMLVVAWPASAADVTPERLLNPLMASTFGAGTLAAVQQFQCARRLPVTGIDATTAARSGAVIRTQLNLRASGP